MFGDFALSLVKKLEGVFWHSIAQVVFKDKSIKLALPLVPVNHETCSCQP